MFKTPDKNRKIDRILMLKSVGKNTVDQRFFTGENNIHAIVDPQTMHWYLKQEHGILAEPFKQRFTSFTQLLKFVTNYYKRRNIEIIKVID